MISNLFSSLSFSSSTLPSPKNTKLSHPSLSLHAMIKSSLWVQHSLSTAYTEYSIHRVLHTLRNAYTAYCIIPRSTIFRSQQVSSPGRHCCTHFSTFPPSRVNQWMKSQLPLRLPPELPPPDCSPLRAPPISLNHGLQVHLQSRSITANKRISEVNRSSVSKCISKVARARPPCAPPSSLDLGRQAPRQTRPITPAKCISEFTRSRSPSASPRSFDPGLHVHRC